MRDRDRTGATWFKVVGREIQKQNPGLLMPLSGHQTTRSGMLKTARLTSQLSGPHLQSVVLSRIQLISSSNTQHAHTHTQTCHALGARGPDPRIPMVPGWRRADSGADSGHAGSGPPTFSVQRSRRSLPPLRTGDRKTGVGPDSAWTPLARTSIPAENPYRFSFP